MPNNEDAQQCASQQGMRTRCSRACPFDGIVFGCVNCLRHPCMWDPCDPMDCNWIGCSREQGDLPLSRGDIEVFGCPDVPCLHMILALATFGAGML